MDAKKQGGDKQKDPYYFTFFNEKNEAAKKPEAGDMTPEEINTGKLKMHGLKGTFTSTSMITDTSHENFPSALSIIPEIKEPKKTIPTKPQFKKKLDHRTEASALSNHNPKK